MRLSQLPGLLAELAAPPACAVCGTDCGPRAILCTRCERGLAGKSGVELQIEGIDAAWAARPYDGVARELVAAIKFRSLVPAVWRAAELISEEAPPGLLDRVVDGFLVPVPADPIRAAWRGFDPAYSLARTLMHTARLPFCYCLDRRHDRRQVGRSRSERLASPPRVHAGPSAPGRVILVDDVTTTGATLSACARAVRAAGAREVHAVAFAASPRAFGAAGSRA
jgi:predicted amidophosphoribosyltransferase